MNRTKSVTTLLLALVLAASAATATASPSNKWRLQFSGKANSDGVITITVHPQGGTPITTEIPVKDNTGENGVAKTVVKGLEANLPKEAYHVERDDGEDVLVKKRHGAANFDLTIDSNTVKGVRINPDKE